jgi:tRNA threonylcarbamoyladenosine biosynthesis protein TsaE
VGRGLELDESVVSPTFTLIHAYDLPFVRRRAARFIHMDLYRLGTVEEAEQIGVDDCQQEDAIVLIEWPESALPLLDADRLELTIEGCGDQPRRLTFQSAAEAWRQRLAEGDIP